MSKKEQISFYKNQLASAKTLKACARQLLREAAQLESGAISALDMLGNSPGRSRKGDDVLPDNVKLRLIGGLTKDKSA
ncbi:hypothetical protein [Flavobacterium sp. 102]|uniref:hypothetical protein n=1 Tax=Flavobacterium sp. 102 TaxID=2135623 RepID=UPI000EB42F38|nr:hypothetical protein [Flavobacterium sp. 102]RKS00463.1 hypothetical protein C8C84_0073 [Flavobacterium sp. 102]